jgi:hypothetical protein
MKEQPLLAELLEKWCGEATSLWGDDWLHIEGHIRTKFDALSDSEQSRLKGEAALTLLDPVKASHTRH